MEVKKKRPRTFVRERVEGSSQEATERKHKRLKLDLETKCGKLATKLAKPSKKLARLASGGNFSTKQLERHGPHVRRTARHQRADDEA